MFSFLLESREALGVTLHPLLHEDPSSNFQPHVSKTSVAADTCNSRSVRSRFRRVMGTSWLSG